MIQASSNRGACDMANEFWLSDVQWAAIEPLLPGNKPGARRIDDRRVISGILHVLKAGCRWQDCPSVYGPPTTIYNRFNRWSGRSIWQCLLQALIQASSDDIQLIDSTTAKAHRSAAGGKGGRRRRRLAARAAGARQRSMLSSTERGVRSPSK
jgi:putative transposase